MNVLKPGDCIGIMGGGQLGRMLAISAAQLGLNCHIYTNQPGPACDVARDFTVAPYDDMERIEKFAQSVDVVTYEFENVPLDAAAHAQKHAPVRPGPKALEVAQDRVREKQFIEGLGLAVAPFAPVSNSEDLRAGLAKLAKPAILKTSRLGYDGKGQARIEDPGDHARAAAAFDEIGCAPSVLEARLSFVFEISVLLVRSHDGRCVYYDVPMNTHKNGILDESLVPAPLARKTVEHAHDVAKAIADALDYIGVLAVEMFYLGDDCPETLVVNEIAPRVHNSGHWTLDACSVSQFENQIRAVAGWPLGSTARHSDAVMTNLIGADVEAWPTLAAEQNACIHLYGKSQVRAGRKMGHVTHLTPRVE